MAAAEPDSASNSSSDSDHEEQLQASRPLLRSELHEKGRRYFAGGQYRPRFLKNKAVYLVLALNLLVFSYQFQSLPTILTLIPTVHRGEPWKTAMATIVFQYFVPGLLYPVAGWLADVKYGRYKVIRASMRLMWVGSVLLQLTLLLRYFFTYINIPSHKTALGGVSTVVVLLLYLVNAVGIAGFHSNIIPFGLDQMEDGSAEQYSAFIHWYYWTRNLSLGTLVWLGIYSQGSVCNTTSGKFAELYIDRADLIALVSNVGLLSLALCLDFIFSYLLVKEPKTQNPLKTVLSVSCFIAKHKQPVGRRSAFTYSWGKGIPSRSDLAKNLYGGPFESEAVEAVKTFWRIIAFLLSLGGAMIVESIASGTYQLFADHTSPPHSGVHLCSGQTLIANAVNPLTFAVLIPLYEFVIFPFFYRFILAMLRRIGWGMIVYFLGIIVLMLLDVIGHRQDSTGECLFYKSLNDTASDLTLNLDPRLLILPIVMMSFGEFLIFIPALEFICAQSPHTMRGLLVGLFYLIYGIFNGVAALLLLLFAKTFESHKLTRHPLSCGSWFYLATAVIALVGIVIYFFTSRWYKKRQRGGQEFVNERAVLESYYDTSTES